VVTRHDHKPREIGDLARVIVTGSMQAGSARGERSSGPVRGAAIPRTGVRKKAQFVRAFLLNSGKESEVLIIKAVPPMRRVHGATSCYPSRAPDGIQPNAGLINVLGPLYGTVSAGGACHGGTVFKVTP